MIPKMSDFFLNTAADDTGEGSEDGHRVKTLASAAVVRWLSVHHSTQVETISPVVNSPHQQLSTLQFL